jgi:hypothetical protein
MTASGDPASSRQTTAMFMRSQLHQSTEDAHIVQCPVCLKATVPVPDPQRPAQATHCYRCGAEYAIISCSSCGAAAIAAPGPAAGGGSCDACRA